MTLSFDLEEISKQADQNNGIDAFTLGAFINQYLAEFSTSQIKITLDNDKEIEFLLFSENGKNSIISTACLSSNCEPGIGVKIECLPEILKKLADKKIQFDLLQFPHAFTVTGRVTGRVYRSHFNHIAMYKQNDQITVGIIDSTINPFGVSNPLGIFSHSILSGQELTHNTLMRLCNTEIARATLSTLLGMEPDKEVAIANTIYTRCQPSVNNKRCGVYVINAMAKLTNIFLQESEINSDTIVATVFKAHQQLNAVKVEAKIETDSTLENVVLESWDSDLEDSDTEEQQVRPHL